MAFRVEKINFLLTLYFITSYNWNFGKVDVRESIDSTYRVSQNKRNPRM